MLLIGSERLTMKLPPKCNLPGIRKVYKIAEQVMKLDKELNMNLHLTTSKPSSQPMQKNGKAKLSGTQNLKLTTR
jgi:hypothetical protein